MRIALPLLLAVSALTFAGGACAQMPAATPGQSSLPRGATAMPGPLPAALPVNVASSNARTIDLAGLRTTPPRDTARLTQAPEPVAPALRGAAGETEPTPEPRAVEGLRSIINVLPRDVFRPTGRAQRSGRVPFEAPNLHVVATEGVETASASPFEELN